MVTVFPVGVVRARRRNPGLRSISLRSISLCNFRLRPVRLCLYRLGAL